MITRQEPSKNYVKFYSLHGGFGQSRKSFKNIFVEEVPMIYEAYSYPMVCVLCARIFNTLLSFRILFWSCREKLNINIDPIYYVILFIESMKNKVCYGTLKGGLYS